tara:strand:+ start:275 stop:580 length:306 start_codon:yes stop_codon:yes gene_type:complete
MFDKNNFCSLLLGFILGYSVNYYNKKIIQDIVDRIELFETKNLFIEQDIKSLKLNSLKNENLIKELNEKQESLIYMKKEKKKRNKIEVQYDDVDFGIHTPQ